LSPKTTPSLPFKGAGLTIYYVASAILNVAYMLVVQVNILVKPESVEAFKTATLENARCSIQEPGIARFDVLQQPDEPTRFVLIEAYRSTANQAAHRSTPHYLRWRDTVASMMAEPRTSIKFEGLFPLEIV
jgi:autoinducer 2-degrading protein